MAKEAYYFSHDYGARNDNKLQKVLMKLGQEGKGVYWDLIEMLFEEGGNLKLSECESYAFALHTDIKIIQSLINDFDLFEKDKNYFWSNSVLKRLKIREEKSENAAKSARIRWDRANAMQEECKGNAIKEKKGKEIKEKEKKGKENIIQPESKEVNEIIKIYENLFKKTYRLSQNERVEICHITNQEQYTLEDWELIFKNASKGWNINNENVKPSLTNILENYSKFLNDDYNLGGKSNKKGVSDEKLNEIFNRKE